MLLSIFNSDRPSAKWARAVFCGLAVAVVALGALEFVLRTHGSGPSVHDTQRLWATWRKEVDHSNASTVALVGASRMQLGFSTAAWHTAFPNDRVLQLAINGGSSLPVLEDLAENTTFDGLVLCEFDSWHFLHIEQRQHAADFVDFFHTHWFSPFLDLEVWLRAQCQDRLALLREAPGIGKAIKSFVQGRGLKFNPYYIRIHYNRNIDGDFSRVDAAAIAAKWVEEYPSVLREFSKLTPSIRDAELRRLRAAIEKIQKRGGKVVLIRFPTSGEIREMERVAMPRETHWNEIVQGIPSIHFEDVPAMRELECPDQSHLDVRDKPRFTSALAEAVAKMNLR